MHTESEIGNVMVEQLAKTRVEQLDEDVIKIIDMYGVNVVKYAVMNHFEISTSHWEDLRLIEEWQRSTLSSDGILRRRKHVFDLIMTVLHSASDPLTVPRVVKEVVLADGNIVYQEVTRELYHNLRHWVIAIDAEGGITVFDQPKDL